MRILMSRSISGPDLDLSPGVVYDLEDTFAAQLIANGDAVLASVPVVALTQAEYDALGTPDPAVLYVIQG